PRVEELRVDHAPHLPINIVGGETLEQPERSRPTHVDLAERGEVEQGNPLPHGLMLGPDQLEESGSAPTPSALIGPRAPAGPSGLEVVDALPAVLLTEDRAQREETGVERAQPPQPCPFVLVVRVAQRVVVLVRL